MSTTLPNLITFDNLNFNSTSTKFIHKKPLIESSNLPKISLDIVKKFPNTISKIQNNSQKEIQQNLLNSQLKLPKVQTQISSEKRFLLVFGGETIENPKDANLINATGKILNKIIRKSISTFDNKNSNPNQNPNSHLKLDSDNLENSQYLPKNFYITTTPNFGVISNYENKLYKSIKNSVQKLFQSSKLPPTLEKANNLQSLETTTNSSIFSLNLTVNPVYNLSSKTLFWQDISTDLQFCTQIWANSAKVRFDPKIQKTQKYFKLAIFCVVSIFKQMVSSCFYQTFLALTNLQNLVQFLPSFSTKITKKIQIQTQNELQKQITKWTEIITQEFNRDFWWLETQLEIRKINLKLVKISKSLFFLMKQFYLAIFVIYTLFGLFVIGQTKNTSQISNQSLLSKFVEKNTIKFDTIAVNAQKSTLIIDFRSFNSVSKEENNQNVKKIVAHTFSANDNLEKLGELYNLSIQTIKFNNKIKDGEIPKIGQILFIPWSNGYIYNTTEEINSGELAKFYKIDEKLLISENRAFWDEKTGKFPKDKLILIPTTNFDQITEFTNAEKVRRENLEKSDKQRTQMLNYTAVSGKNTSAKSNPFGFIWPTVGSISRCVQPGHIACDIANFNSPPIYSVQDGTILASGWKDGGFGYMTLIDHGNGVQTMYMHMSEVYTKTGQKVKQGQSIGKMGCTGNCSGAHLHFEVRVNKIQQNPLLYLP